MIVYTENLNLSSLLDQAYQEGKAQIGYQGHLFTIRLEKPEPFSVQPKLPSVQPEPLSVQPEPLSVQLVRECREKSAKRWDNFFDKYDK